MLVYKPKKTIEIRCTKCEWSKTVTISGYSDSLSRIEDIINWGKEREIFEKYKKYPPAVER